MTATDDALEQIGELAAPDRGLDAQPLPEDPDLRRFAAALGALWEDVSEWTTPLDDAASRELADLMDAVRRQNIAAGLVVNQACAHGADLSALRAGWPHFSPGQKAVLNAATAYLILADRGTAASGAGEHVDVVVTAAVRALLQRR